MLSVRVTPPRKLAAVSLKSKRNEKRKGSLQPRSLSECEGNNPQQEMNEEERERMGRKKKKGRKKLTSKTQALLLAPARW